MTVLKPETLQRLQSALEAHRQGRLPEAERGYRAVLAQAPQTLDASNLLGRLLVQTGRASEAVATLRRAVDLAPKQAGLWLSYAEALLGAGQVEQARQAVETARRLSPRDVNVLFLWAETQRIAGAWETAATGFRQALALQPKHAASWLQLATCLRALNDPPGAIAAAEQALSHAPQAPECHNNLGSLLAAKGDHGGAIAAFDQALKLRVDYPAALINKASSLGENGRLDEALPLAERAVQLTQGHADAWACLGQIRHAQGQLDLAQTAYREALSRRPQDPETQWNFALAALARGDFAAGWPAFAWRWRKAEPPLPRRNWPWPRFQNGGSPKRLLLWGEQGLDDRLLFLQYLPPLLEAASVMLETDPRLIPLLRRSFPTLSFTEEKTQADLALMNEAFDAHLPLGDLPQAAPPGQAYLLADAERAAGLRQEYLAGGKVRLIGLSWRSANPAIGAGKSLRPEDLAPLAAILDCRFVCLQYGATEDEHAQFRALFGDRFIVDDRIDAKNDLDALAAQIAALDLVITVSNVTAHLAGALGRPVWTLAPAGKSLFFYLMAAGETTPWYPTMRIFRSPAPGSWRVPVHAVAKRLESLAN